MIELKHEVQTNTYPVVQAYLNDTPVFQLYERRKQVEEKNIFSNNIHRKGDRWIIRLGKVAGVKAKFGVTMHITPHRVFGIIEPRLEWEKTISGWEKTTSHYAEISRELVSNSIKEITP